MFRRNYSVTFLYQSLSSISTEHIRTNKITQNTSSLGKWRSSCLPALFNRRLERIHITKLIPSSQLPTTCRNSRKPEILRYVISFTVYVSTFLPLIFLINLSQFISFHHANEGIYSCIQNTHYLNKMATVSIYKMGTTLNFNNY